MASAPFQTAGNVADIAPVQLRGGFPPAPGIVDTILEVAEVAIPVIRQNVEAAITDEVTGKTKSVRLALQATRFPSIQASAFSEEALANPIVKQALVEFTKIQNATKQGVLPAQFALVRLEVIQNNAIKNSPEFEQEIRAALMDATGQDPSRTIFSRLLKDAKKVLSPEERALEQLKIDSIKKGVTVDELISMNHSLFESQVAGSRFDLAAKEGTYNLQSLSGDIRNRSALIMVDTLNDMREITVAGQDFNPDTVTALKARIGQSIAAATAAIMAKTTGLAISGTAITAELAPLKVLQENMNNMIDDGSMAKMITSHNSVTISSIRANILGINDYAVAYAIGGSQGFVQMLEWVDKAGKTEQGKALVSALSNKANIAFDLQGIVKQYGRIGSHDLIETVQDKENRVVAGGIILATSGAKEEFQIAALEDIRKYGGEELAWSAFESNKVLTATAKSNKIKAAFINMQVSTTAGLSQELVDLASIPSIQLTRLTLSEEGVLSVEERPLAERVDLAQTAKSADVAMQEFVRRFNRANRISAKYNGAGVLPAARYGGPVDYWNLVSEAAKDITSPRGDADAKVIKFIRDADGNLVLATEGE